MAIEMNSDLVICFKCGRRYGRRKGYFPVNYSILYKGVGYLPICKDCIDTMYNEYLAQCGNAKDAVRQMCRKLDLYWDENVFEIVMRKSTTRSMMTQYIAKTNSVSYAGKSYDDTLSKEGTLWNLDLTPPDTDTSETSLDEQEDSDQDVKIENEVDEYINELTSYPVTKDVVAFWGTGYSPSMYAELEQRRAYYMSKLSNDAELDVGMEAIIRQICSLELDINRDRAAGKAVDKSVNALNTLLGSANWKPIQKKDGADSPFINPLGVWLNRYENEKPLPKVSKSLEDVNGIKKNVFTWMGHLCKMLSKKNGYTRMYEEEINRLRVEKPEYADEDDETLLMDAYSEEGGSS